MHGDDGPSIVKR